MSEHYSHTLHDGEYIHIRQTVKIIHYSVILLLIVDVDNQAALLGQDVIEENPEGFQMLCKFVLQAANFPKYLVDWKVSWSIRRSSDFMGFTVFRESS